MSTHQSIAEQVYTTFRTYRNAFSNITSLARSRFETADWLAGQRAGTERLALYKAHLLPLVEHLQKTYNPGQIDWPATRAAYAATIASVADAELAETFYNSVYRCITDDAPVNDREMFVNSSVSDAQLLDGARLLTEFEPREGVVQMLKDILLSFDIRLPWRDIDKDVGNVLRSLAEARPEIRSTRHLKVEILNDVFFRNKGAYLIGRVKYQQQAWPVALPLLLTESGEIYVDTLICDEDELSVVFSFTRAYFMVATPHPRALVRYLNELLPNKKLSELYAAIGLNKHGKTEFYRGFVEHLANSDDQFIIAPGIKGMVMAVFTLPSYQTVFKVIKDRFAPQKNITAADVREKYTIVKHHDRVGRMADTQEFENLAFPRERFSEDLIDELLEVAGKSVVLSEDRIMIRHLYTERHMTPLNIYIETASDSELRQALDEYGNAIKQLAAANIFPGDMLLKNFGITRHGRVVFYDYDEICYLTDVNFRNIPQPRTPEEEMSGEIWYTVREGDVFPEEFRTFLFGKRQVKNLFAQMHGELFDPDYWRSLQQGILAGRVTDVFPYRRKKRFEQIPQPA